MTLSQHLEELRKALDELKEAIDKSLSFSIFMEWISNKIERWLK